MLGIDENSYINSNNQDLPIDKKCWDFVVYTLEEVITLSYIISYTRQILLKVNGSSIHEDFWCGFQEFIINQGINGLFGGTGWKSYKEMFPWKKTPLLLNKHFVFTELLPNPRLWIIHGSVESLPEASGPQTLEVLGLKAAHTCICSVAAYPAPEQTGVSVTIPLPELLKLEGFWLQGSHVQQFCPRKGGSGCLLQPPWEINAFEHQWSQESFQIDWRKLNKRLFSSEAKQAELI